MRAANREVYRVTKQFTLVVVRLPEQTATFLDVDKK